MGYSTFLLLSQATKPPFKGHVLWLSSLERFLPIKSALRLSKVKKRVIFLFTGEVRNLPRVTQLLRRPKREQTRLSTLLSLAILIPTFLRLEHQSGFKTAAEMCKCHPCSQREQISSSEHCGVSCSISSDTNNQPYRFPKLPTH